MPNPETKQPDQDSMVGAALPPDEDPMVVSIPVSTEPFVALNDNSAPKEWFRNVVLSDSLNSMLEEAITVIENEKNKMRKSEKPGFDGINVSRPVQVKKSKVKINKKNNNLEAETERKIQAGLMDTEKSEKKKEWKLKRMKRMKKYMEKKLKWENKMKEKMKMKEEKKKKRDEAIAVVVNCANEAVVDESEKKNEVGSVDGRKRIRDEISDSPFQVEEPQVEIEVEKKKSEEVIAVVANDGNDVGADQESEKKNKDKIEAGPVDIEVSEKKKKRKRRKKSEEVIAAAIDGADDVGAGESAKMEICKDVEDGDGRKCRLDEIDDIPFQVEEPQVEIEVEKKNKEDSDVIAASVDTKNGKTGKENDEKIEAVSVHTDNLEKKKKMKKKKKSEESEDAVSVFDNGANDAGANDSEEKNGDKIEAGSMDTDIAEKKKSEEVIAVVDGADNARDDEREKMKICKDEEDGDGGKCKLDEISDSHFQVEEPQIEIEVEKKKSEEVIAVLANDGNDVGDDQESEKKNKNTIESSPVDIKVSEKKKKRKKKKSGEVIAAVVDGAGAGESAKMEICKDVEDGDGRTRKLDEINDSPFQVEEPQVEIELEKKKNKEDSDVIAASVDTKNSGKTEKENDEKIEAVSVGTENFEKKKKRKKKKKSEESEEVVAVVVNGANDAGADDSEKKNRDKIKAGSMDTDIAEKKRSEEVIAVVDGADNAGDDEREKMKNCKDEEDRDGGKRKLDEISDSHFQDEEPQVVEVELEKKKKRKKKNKEDCDVIAGSVDTENSGKTEKENEDKIGAVSVDTEISEKKKKKKKKSEETEEVIAAVVTGGNDAGVDAVDKENSGKTEMKNEDKIESVSVDTQISEKKKKKKKKKSEETEDIVAVVTGGNDAGVDGSEKKNKRKDSAEV